MIESAHEDWRGPAVHGSGGNWIGQIAEVYDDVLNRPAADPLLTRSTAIAARVSGT